MSTNQSKFYVTGPCATSIIKYVGSNIPVVVTSGSVSPRFLGWAERSPDIQFECEYEGTLNTTGGSRFASLYTYQGSEATIDIVYTRVELSALQDIVWTHFNLTRNVSNMVDSLNILPGYPASPEICNIGGVAYSLLIAFPYTNQTLVFPRVAPRMLRWFDLGSVASKMFVRFRAIRVNAVAGSTGGSGTIYANVWMLAYLIDGLHGIPAHEQVRGLSTTGTSGGTTGGTTGGR